MPSLNKFSICLYPRLEGLGGPSSFQKRLADGLRARGYQVHHDLRQPNCAAILVIGGTQHLWELWQARRRGVRIIQRLNGINWIHRKQPTSLSLILRAERNNLQLALIRRFLADCIVYQSRFARDWWQTVYRHTSASSHVIYNGVDLCLFNPVAPQGSALAEELQRPQERSRLLLVEGHLDSTNRQGLDNAIQLLRQLNHDSGQQFELMIVGRVHEALKSEYKQEPYLQWVGVVPGERIAEINRSAHLLFSADLNAACPNSVIEALACGLPVIAFATGSLPELIQGDAGRVVPYGSNYWNLEPPNISPLADAARLVMAELPHFRQAARRRAEEAFDVNQMIENYLNVMLG